MRIRQVKVVLDKESYVDLAVERVQAFDPGARFSWMRQPDGRISLKIELSKDIGADDFSRQTGLSLPPDLICGVN